ncbi:GNAT family N-acetyltransferase [Teredinibacter turnerae]|uniref:GNAT family N-acetyltransferase n=1 Tax=Teredinibacter turnerae TaxID=2426 RepID=UPI00036BB019|nr:GNAT family N-acetyltransferase [Teredinibacter turnerae]
MVEGYRIKSKFEDMDVEKVHGFISRSYWAENIPFSIMRKAMKNSLCFGLFTASNEQVGFARVVTDSATFAYLADVFVHEDHRGRGLSKWLVEHILQHGSLQGLRRMILATADAHGLYAKYGFNELAKPEIYMESMNQNVYKNA